MIGDGRNTNVWLDHWLLMIPPCKVIHVSYNQNMRVEEFIDKDTCSWNVLKLEQLLQPLKVA